MTVQMALDLVIRPARPDDSADMAELLTQLGYPHDGRQALERLREWAGEPRAIILLAQCGGAVVGFAAVCAIPHIQRSGYIGRVMGLAVLDEQRRAGVGRVLLEAAEAWAREQGCVDMEITSNRRRDAAHAFYPARGYEDVSPKAARYWRSVG